jgi:hypothetical protein
MNKCIPAEKLKEKIQSLYEDAKKCAHFAAQTGTSSDCAKYDEAKSIYEHILWLIDAFQQEQESVAERFARIIRGNLTGIDKEVQQKFEQLYFEVTGNKMYGGYND